MRSRIVILALGLGFALAQCARCDIFLYAPWEKKARDLFGEWSFGGKTTEATIAELREIAEDGSADDAGRVYALHCLAWLDIASDQVDLRDVIKWFATRTDVPSYIRVYARVIDWELEVFGENLGEAAQVALLRGILNGRAGGDEVSDQTRRWAADELCARGQLDDMVRRELARQYGGGGRMEISQCERQRAFIDGPRDEAAVRAALQVPDLSKSQAFRILVLQSALQLKGKEASDTLSKVRTFLGTGEPPVILATRDAVLELARGAETPEQLVSKGLNQKVADLVARSRERSRAPN